MTQVIPSTDNIGFPVEDSVVEHIKATYWPLIRAKGYYIIVKPFKRAEKTQGGIIIPGMAAKEDVHQTQVGQVIDIGPLAYTNDAVTGGLAWCKIGDWVTFPRIAGAMIFKKKVGDEQDDVAFRRIKDDDIDGTISNPEDWVVGILR